MRTSFLGIAASLAVSLIVTSAMATPAEDAAYDTNSQPIYDSQGGCVRTKWMGDTNPCGKEAPKPVAKKFVPMPIPAAAVPEVELEQRTIYFDFNSAGLDAESREKLDNLAKIVNDSSSVADVRIHGFTDQLGTTGYNEALANKRAAAVKHYLDSKSRLRSTVAEVKGLGKASPTEGCDDMKDRAEKISCMAKERRVEIELKATK
jgi:OOP family OmpA-OmpF porin